MVTPEELDPRTRCGCGAEATLMRLGHLMCPECAQAMEQQEYDDFPIEEC